MPFSASLPSRVKAGFIKGAMNLVMPLNVKSAVCVTSVWLIAVSQPTSRKVRVPSATMRRDLDVSPDRSR